MFSMIVVLLFAAGVSWMGGCHGNLHGLLGVLVMKCDDIYPSNDSHGLIIYSSHFLSLFP